MQLLTLKERKMLNKVILTTTTKSDHEKFKELSYNDMRMGVVIF